MAAVGGTTVWVPATARGSKLADLVGIGPAIALSRAFGGENVRIPMGAGRGPAARNQRARQLLRQGMSVVDVARATELHETTVQRIKSSERAGDDPTPLQYRLDL